MRTYFRAMVRMAHPTHLQRAAAASEIEPKRLQLFQT